MKRREFLSFGAGTLLAGALSACSGASDQRVSGTVRSLHHSGGMTSYYHHRIRRSPDYYYVYVDTPHNSYQRCLVSASQFYQLRVGDTVQAMACR